MTHEDQECLRLGREIVRMIGELQAVTEGETGCSRRKFTFRGGAVYLFLVNDSELADTMSRAAEKDYAVQDVIPPRALN